MRPDYRKRKKKRESDFCEPGMKRIFDQLEYCVVRLLLLALLLIAVYHLLDGQIHISHLWH
jgi:hypothetical protein